MTARSAARRDHRGQGEPGQVECGRERLDLEVADRDHPILVDEDERVGLGGVELDRDLSGDEAEGVAGRSVELGEGAEAEWVLQRPCLRLATVEQGLRAASVACSPG